MRIKDKNGNDLHLNPRHVVMAYVMKIDSDNDYMIDLTTKETIWVDYNSYERIVKWIDEHDG